MLLRWNFHIPHLSIWNRQNIRARARKHTHTISARITLVFIAF